MLNSKPDNNEPKENISSVSVIDHLITSLPTVNEGKNMSFETLKDENEDCQTIRTLFQAGFDLNTLDKDDLTPAHIAAGEGHVKILRVLHELGN